MPTSLIDDAYAARACFRSPPAFQPGWSDLEPGASAGVDLNTATLRDRIQEIKIVPQLTNGQVCTIGVFVGVAGLIVGAGEALTSWQAVAVVSAVLATALLLVRSFDRESKEQQHAFG
jgi:hypothetical protein